MLTAQRIIPIFVLCIVFSKSSFAQLSIERSKNSFVLKHGEETILQSIDSMWLPDLKGHDNMFFTNNDGYINLWQLDESHVPYAITDGTIIEVSYYYDMSTYVFEDYFGNEYEIKEDGELGFLDYYYRRQYQACANNKGMMGICTEDSIVIPYIYEDVQSIYYYGEKWFVAKTDSGNIIIDTLGKTVCAQHMDTYYTSGIHESVIMGSNENGEWMVFDTEGKFKLKPTVVDNPWSTFIFDGPSFADLNNTLAICQKDGKLGLLDMFGNQLIPYAYDNVQPAYSLIYSEWGDSIESLSSFAVRGDSLSKDWIIMDDNYEPILEIQADQFVGSKYDLALFIENDKVKFMNIGTGEDETAIQLENLTSQILNFGDQYLVIDSLGKVILPPGRSRYRENVISGGRFYFVNTYGYGKDVIYSLDGEDLSSHIHFDNLGDVCIGEIDLFKVSLGNYGKESRSGIIAFDRNSQRFELLVPMDFNSISCHSLEFEKPIAIGEKPDDSKWYIYRDGRLEPKEN